MEKFFEYFSHFRFKRMCVHVCDWLLQLIPCFNRFLFFLSFLFWRIYSSIGTTNWRIQRDRRNEMHTRNIWKEKRVDKLNKWNKFLWKEAIKAEKIFTNTEQTYELNSKTHCVSLLNTYLFTLTFSLWSIWPSFPLQWCLLFKP